MRQLFPPVRLFRLLPALLCAILALPLHAGSESRDAARAWKQKDYETALKIYQPLAESGDAHAQHRLGIAYLRGMGVGRNPARAAFWLKQAAAQGRSGSQFHLGRLYLRGRGVKRNPELARNWLEKAASQGDERAARLLKQLHKAPVKAGKPSDETKAAAADSKSGSRGATAKAPAAIAQAASAGADPTSLGMAHLAYTMAMDDARGGDFTRSLSNLQMAVELDPTRLAYREALAYAYAAHGGPKASAMAIEQYREVLKQEPGRTQGLYSLAQSALISDSPMIAIEALETLFYNGGEYNLDVLGDLGTLYAAVNVPQRGISLLQSIQGPTRDHPGVRLMLANLLALTGQRQQAVDIAGLVMEEAGPESEIGVLAGRLAADWERR